VIVGDEPPKTVRERGAHRALDREPAAQGLLRQGPDEIIDVWAFRTPPAQRHAWEYFGDRPDTPYGYYSSRHHALIMNIGWGTGRWSTRSSPVHAHELPRGPPWLNEGLASLYERPAEDAATSSAT
jgi:hypothetical protein